MQFQFFLCKLHWIWNEQTNFQTIQYTVKTGIETPVIAKSSSYLNLLILTILQRNGECSFSIHRYYWKTPLFSFDFLLSKNNVTAYLHVPVNQKSCYQNNQEIVVNNNIGSFFLYY